MLYIKIDKEKSKNLRLEIDLIEKIIAIIICRLTNTLVFHALIASFSCGLSRID